MKLLEGRVYYGWVVVFATFLAMLVISLPVYTFGVFIEPLTDAFGWSRANISGAVSIFQLLVGMLAFGFGRLSDRYDIRLTMGIGTVLILLSFFACSKIASLTHLYLAFAGLGIGSSALYVPMTSTVASWFRKRKGLAVGLAVTAFGVGMASFSPLLEMLISNYGWRNTFLISGAFSFFLLLVSISLMRNPPDDPEDRIKIGLESEEGSDDPGSDDMTPGEAVRTKSFWLTYFSLLFAYISAFFVTTHIVPNALGLGISSLYAATLLTVIGVFNVAGRLLGGFTSDEFGVTRALTLLFTAQAISLFLLANLTSLWSIYSVALLFGISYGGWAMILPVITNDFFGRTHSGQIMGLFETVTGIGGAMGPYFAGYIYDLTGQYTLAFLIAGTITLVGVVLTVFLRRYSRKEGLIGKN